MINFQVFGFSGKICWVNVFSEQTFWLCVRCKKWYEIALFCLKGGHVDLDEKQILKLSIHAALHVCGSEKFLRTKAWRKL